jgi:hypothetical protein
MEIMMAPWKSNKPKWSELTFDGRKIKPRDVPGITIGILEKQGYRSSATLRETSGMSEATLKRWYDQGLIKGRKLAKAWYYLAADVHRVMEERRML